MTQEKSIYVLYVVEKFMWISQYISVAGKRNLALISGARAVSFA